MARLQLALKSQARPGQVVKKRPVDEEDEEDNDVMEEEEEKPKALKKNATKSKKLVEDEEDEDEKPNKKAKASPKKKAPVKNSKTPAPLASARIIGAVDEEFAGKNGRVVGDDESNPYDAYLCFVEGNSDKYYVLQVIEQEDEFICFSRWGRTGTKGQQQIQGPFDDMEDAVSSFEKKFKEKTGNDWSAFIEGDFKQKGGKYDCLVSPIAAGVKAARKSGVDWEYEVDDNVAGKENGWYPYDEENANEVEAIYQAWKLNPKAATNLSQRAIGSSSSGYPYQLDLINMTQTNTKTNKVRNIRRVNPNNFALGKGSDKKEKDDDEVEEDGEEEEEEEDSKKKKGKQTALDNKKRKNVKEDDKRKREKNVEEEEETDKTGALCKILLNKETYELPEVDLSKVSSKNVKESYKVLEKLKDELNKSSFDHEKIKKLSDEFYSMIPMKNKLIISDLDEVQNKFNFVENVLESLLLGYEYAKNNSNKTADTLLSELKVELTLLDAKTSKEFKSIEQYVKDTSGVLQWGTAPKLLNIWSVNQENSKADSSLPNRKLLWYGSHVGSTFSILSNGLKVPKYARGRIGKGIHLTSNQSNAALNVVVAKKRIGIMFLVEAALGVEHKVTCDQSENDKLPKGFDSIVAVGRKESSFTGKLTLDGNTINFPQGKPKPQSEYSSSSFSFNEYLLPKEDQHRIRFLLTFEWPEEKELTPTMTEVVVPANIVADEEEEDEEENDDDDDEDYDED